MQKVVQTKQKIVKTTAAAVIFELNKNGLDQEINITDDDDSDTSIIAFKEGCFLVYSIFFLCINSLQSKKF